MKNYLSLLLIIALLSACKKTKEENFFPYKPQQQKNISWNTLRLDTIKLQPPSSSYVVESGIDINDKLYIADKYFCTLLTFDTTGVFLNKTLGQGRANNETTIGRIATHSLLANGYLFLLGYNTDHYLYDETRKIKDLFILTTNNRKSDGEADNPFTYTHLYNDIVCRTYDNHVYFNVRAEHPKLNYIEHNKTVLTDGYNISEVSLSEHKNNKLLAKGYPEIYAENPFKYTIFTGVNFDIDKKGNFYVCYEADSLIYKYDRKFNPIECYGFSGRDMDVDYLTINNFAESRKNYRAERNTKGYYSWVEFDDKTNTLFRSYKKGEAQISDGLQIYRDGVLVADVDVPKLMRVAGYIAPYYYSYAISNEDDETMVVYRFKL